jgi:integrative and conjugative element protein (TIGR02256 family)
MSTEFIDFGKPIPELAESALTIPLARQMFKVCLNSKFIELVELRHVIEDEQCVAETLVIDCENDSVPTKNKIGILYRERLGLVFYSNPRRMPHVRALRQDFPATSHQMVVDQGEPACLCLYSEPWSTIERSWTPQRHLNQTMWWLSETAKGTLHQDDQPVEPIYFPYSSCTIVLPPDFSNKLEQKDLILTALPLAEKKVFLIHFITISKDFNAQQSNNQPGLICLMMETPPITHGVIEKFPYDLGTLINQLRHRGVDLLDLLCQEIERNIASKEIFKDDQGKVLLILQIPIKRNDNEVAESKDIKAFVLDTNFGRLGEACGVLFDGTDGRYYKETCFLNQSNTANNDILQSIRLDLLGVEFSLTRKDAQMFSGIVGNKNEFQGVLAGVGALGSSLAEIWYREAWGNWIFIDPDSIKPHNLSRHIAKYFQVGHTKAEAVKRIVEETYFDGYANTSFFADSITNWSNPELTTAVIDSDLVIDATTTLSVPRDLAIADIKRAASVFLTPSGYGSVLLLEDADRKTRLDSLESQYYGAILRSTWGDEHLIGNQGHIWVGAGCRDSSFVISIELVQLHAATLARQVRLRCENPEAAIAVWQSDPQSGAMSAYIVPVSESLTEKVDRWNVLWNTRLQDRAREIRLQHLPNETGGILLGYIDQKLASIFIVDILSAPLDSIEDTTSFVRGVQGLDQELQIARNKTANLVSYIGEWHSHPSGIPPDPSEYDLKLLTYLSNNLNEDGLPGVMLIVSDNNEKWLIKE